MESGTTASTKNDAKPTVLIVDDERLYCDLLGTILSRCGYEVLTASSGREGLKLFHQHRPRFTMLDLRLPDIHGIEVLREIRKLDQRATVMVLTNWGTDQAEQQARQLGVKDFFSKKMTLDTIMSSMERGFKPPAGTPTVEPSRSAEVATAQAPAAQRSAVPSERGSGEVIVVVDDEPQVLDMLSQFLTQRGYRVRSATCGEEALPLVDRERPALIILDMYMPGMNGVGVLRHLYEKKNTSGIILLSGSQDEKLLAESLDLGVVQIIGKPVDLEQLALAVHIGLQIKSR